MHWVSLLTTRFYSLPFKDYARTLRCSTNAAEKLAVKCEVLPEVAPSTLRWQEHAAHHTYDVLACQAQCLLRAIAWETTFRKLAMVRTCSEWLASTLGILLSVCQIYECFCICSCVGCKYCKITNIRNKRIGQDKIR